jgi:hypothetical protein
MLRGSEEISISRMSHTDASSRHVPIAQGCHCTSEDHFQMYDPGSDARFRAVSI